MSLTFKIPTSKYFLSSLCGYSTLLNHHFLTSTFCSGGVKSRHPSWSVWKSVSSHVFAVSFSYYAEGSRVSVRYVCYRVSVQRGLVGDRTNLLDGQLRTWLGSARKGHFKRFIIAERYVGTGAKASSGLLGGCGGILRCGLWNVLIQPGTSNDNEFLLLHRWITCCSLIRSYLPLDIHIFFFQERVGDEGHEDRMVSDCWPLKAPLLMDLFLLVRLQTFIVFYKAKSITQTCRSHFENSSLFTRKFHPNSFILILQHVLTERSNVDLSCYLSFSQQLFLGEGSVTVGTSPSARGILALL